MIAGHVEFSPKEQLCVLSCYRPPSKQFIFFWRPGKYLALDCEMVGVGIDGSESSLARVSIVNFYGAVLIDEFVRQRERVVDYRTQFGGVRERDLIKGASRR